MHRRTDRTLGRWSLATFAAFAACSASPTTSSNCDDFFVGSTLAAHYAHEPYDTARTKETSKVWHDVFAPDGRRITKGLGGEFEHHRGLFFAFHKTVHAGRTLDFWQCRNGVSQQHVGVCDVTDLGLDNDFRVVAIEWRDATGKAIVHERRALRCSALDARTWRFDFVSELRADEPGRQEGDVRAAAECHCACKRRMDRLRMDGDGPAARRRAGHRAALRDARQSRARALVIARLRTLRLDVRAHAAAGRAVARVLCVDRVARRARRSALRAACSGGHFHGRIGIRNSFKSVSAAGATEQKK
jgi:hypothetical protein